MGNPVSLVLGAIIQQSAPGNTDMTPAHSANAALVASSLWLESADRPSPLFPLSPQEEMHNNVEVVHTYRQHILNDMNPSNLHLFISAYNR